MNCLTTKFIASLCFRCRKSANPAHYIDEPQAVFCADCCPIHGEANHEWPEQKTVEGEQLKLL